MTGVRVGVLVSGSGTILEAMFEAGLPVTVVLSDRPCAALELARTHGAAAELVDRNGYGGFGSAFDRESYTAAVAATLVAHQVDLVAMAGFGTVLSQAVHTAFPDRVLNTHPALLPAFPGWHGVRDALAAGVTETGCTVHLATLEMDAGPILAQHVVPVLPGDTEETLHERIKVAERTLYPETVARALGELEAGRSIEPPARPVRTASPARLRNEEMTSLRALLSVYDKEGLIELAQGLADLGWELVASGNTAAALADAGIAHLQVAEVTGSPEMLGGRVKTLHPKIHGGILADRDVPSHMADLEANGIEAIDLVVTNLYPFSSDPSIELIDIGGPSMVRSAAKNHAHVGILTSPRDYPEVLAELRQGDGSLSDATRRRLARAAFAHTAAYDAAIVAWLDAGGPGPGPGAAELAAVLPPTLHLTLERTAVLRYGENPHQRGARYRTAGTTSWWDDLQQHGGKELSYLNLFDGDAAWRLVHELAQDAGQPAVAIIKHANPCGAAVADDLVTAYERALECDVQSAFGGVVAIGGVVTEALADAVAAGPQADVIIAASYEPAALEKLTTRRKATRLLSGPAPERAVRQLRSLGTSVLVQDIDTFASPRADWSVVTERPPTDEEWRDLVLAWRVCGRTTSNAIAIVNDGQAVGVGAGQQSRVVAAEIAVRKAGEKAKGGAGASDAFFPFPDGLLVLAAAGVTAVVQPGGSVKDGEVIAAADEAGLAMVVTSERHFRH